MGKGIVNMLAGFTVIRAVNLIATAGGMKVNKEEVLKLNKKLNKIKKHK